MGQGEPKKNEVLQLKREVAQLRHELAALDSGPGAALLRAVADNIPDNLMVLDRDGRIRFINWTVPDFSPSQVIGFHPSAFVPKAFHAAMNACFERVLRSGQSDRYETHYRAEDGSVSYWESRVAPIHSAGRVEGLAVISSNVTARTEAAVDRDRLFQMSLDLFCVATHQGYFKRVNPAFTATLGYSSEEMTSSPMIDFVHPDDRQKTAAAFSRLNDGEATVDFDNRYQRKDGTYRLLEWRAVAEAETGLVLAVARDVTDRRALENALHQSQKMDAVGQLAGGIAHDFNNLLLAMSMNMELARRKSDSAQVRSFLDQAKEAVTRGAALTKQLLTFSRAQPLDVKNVDIAARLSSLLEMMRSMVRENIEFDLRLSEDVPTVCVDPTQLDLVILNLCINARDAMPMGGQIRIETASHTLDDSDACALCVRAGNYAVISITDTGVGMDHGIKERIFEPFFTTKAPGKGTGLGLSTAYAVVQRHGGTIQVDSAPARGTTFDIFLPEAAQQQPATDVRAPLDAPGGTETILVAEDAAIVRSSVVHWLQMAGYQVLLASDGIEAAQIAQARGSDIQLAVLDVVMPRLGGIEAGALIANAAPHIGLLYTTGYDGNALEQACIAPASVIAKPYSPEQLLWRVRAAIDANAEK